MYNEKICKFKLNLCKKYKNVLKIIKMFKNGNNKKHGQAIISSKFVNTIWQKCFLKMNSLAIHQIKLMLLPCIVVMTSF